MGMRLAYLSDIHFGHEENIRAWRFAVQLCAELNLDEVFLGGDVFDQVSVGTWSKEPEMENTLQEELDGGFQELKYLRKRLPDATMEFLPGNHESRLRRFLINKAKPLAGLRALDYDNLYRLGELDIECHPEGRPVQKGHLYLAHGHEFPTGTASPAHRALKAVGNNILFGHVHRFSQAFTTCLDGRTIGAWSNGCLASLSPGFSLCPEWCLGFSVVDFTKGGYFNVTQVRIWEEVETGKYMTIIDGNAKREKRSGKTRND
jgi:UDP-2,3-diacylglucosamine pyrophosphatase LpxH